MGLAGHLRSYRETFEYCGEHVSYTTGSSENTDGHKYSCKMDGRIYAVVQEQDR